MDVVHCSVPGGGMDEDKWRLQRLFEEAVSPYGDVRGALANGIEPRAFDALGQTALHLAAASGNVIGIESLISAGVEVDIRSRVAGATPLHVAAAHGNVEVMDVLVGHGADVNALTDGSRESPLHFASCRNSTDAIRLLLSRGALATVVDKDGVTAEERATRRGHVLGAELIRRACVRSRGLER